MKLLTLNTHSIIEPDYENKLYLFIDGVLRIKPHIIALQEVNQSINNPSDNHLKRCSEILSKNGLRYFSEWLPIKCGFELFDEGIGILSLFPIEEKKAILLSENDDYNDWRTRKALGVKVGNDWFYSVHFSWWSDDSDGFKKEWDRFENNIDKNCAVWALGDFNCPSCCKNEGYDYVMSRGWLDSYALAKQRDDGFTISGEIAGWSGNAFKKRIDYIMTNRKCDILSSEVIFNGRNEQVVSDHFGILVNI